MDFTSLTAEMRGGQYSKLVAWEVWNFMSIEHAKAEFDESNIVNIKGYNDSGKSAMLRALDVVFFNIKPNSQTDWIQDDKEYFRIMCYFDDGVCILRDKYINGQGLYELYKEDKVLFSTRQNGMLTRISAVPDVIQEYLGLITSGDWNVNSRSCFEKQLLVQTTGSENERSLNEVLRSEELAVAGEMINSDKNKIKSEISTSTAELEIYNKQVKDSKGVSKELLDKLLDADRNQDLYAEKLSVLNVLAESIKSIDNIPDIPELAQIDGTRLALLSDIKSREDELSQIPDIPTLTSIDTAKLVLLMQIKGILADESDIPDIPDIPQLNSDRLDLLLQIASAEKQNEECDLAARDAEEKYEAIESELEGLTSQMNMLGERYTICPNCGMLIQNGEHGIKSNKGHQANLGALS